MGVGWVWVWNVEMTELACLHGVEGVGSGIPWCFGVVCITHQQWRSLAVAVPAALSLGRPPHASVRALHPPTVHHQHSVVGRLSQLVAAVCGVLFACLLCASPILVVS